jgi:mannose-6-phosphate isomerase
MFLSKHLVPKPWGRSDIPSAFGVPEGERIGEIWYESVDATPLPLLIKWLFTSEKLSIQVHPNDAQAQARGLPTGKEECWIIVAAEPGAVIGIGTKQVMDAEELRMASLSGAIEQLMDWKPVQAGDYFYIPAGTVHAIGGGITLVEVQQYADITYRLYDYLRLDNGKFRALHLDEGVAVARAKPYNDARSGHVIGSKQLVNGPHFRLWLIDSADALSNLPTDGQRWLVPIAGEVMGECALLATEETAPFYGKMLVAMV